MDITLPSLSLKLPLKPTVITIGVAAFVIGVFASFLRSRSRSRSDKEKPRYVPLCERKGTKSFSWRLQNGEPLHFRTSVSPGIMSSKLRNGSVSLASEKYSSTSTLNTVIDGNAMTPQQIGLMGMEALETAINYWEDAIAAYNYQNASGAFAIPSSEEAKFSRAIQEILSESFNLQNKCEQLFLNQGSVLYRADSVSTLSRDNQASEYDHRTFTSMSSIDSFVSAQAEIANLQDFEDAFYEVDTQSLPLYQMSLNHFEEHGIPYRTLRTDILKCNGDMDYLAKVHCLRLAFKFLFNDSKVRTWFIDIGRQIMSDLLIKADKDPKDFIIVFDEMIEYVQDSANHAKSFEELQTRGVKCMTFYDVVLDYILLDAFEDLENPPSTVKAVIQNRWLSVSFKETALATAVWSVLKAKRRVLKFPDGFISHFYNVSEYVTPVLAWGFLGPDEDLKDICSFFKDQIMSFLEDIFNLKKVQYTTIENLATDLLNKAQEHYGIIHQRFYL